MVEDRPCLTDFDVGFYRPGVAVAHRVQTAFADGQLEDPSWLALSDSCFALFVGSPRPLRTHARGGNLLLEYPGHEAST